MTQSTDFDSRLKEATAAVATDFSADSDILLAAFGGFAGGMGIPPFEFFKIASDLPSKKIFIRDLKQSLYHVSLPGLEPGVDGIVRYLRRLMEEQGIRKSVVVGNSGGGYASLLMGALIDADVTYAFSPVSFIGPIARLIHGDRRAPDLFRRAHLTRDTRSEYYDLKRVFQRHGLETEFHIYFCDTGPTGRLDTLHAMRLDVFPNVTVHRYHEGGHDLVKVLRSTGELETLLREALS